MKKKDKRIYITGFMGTGKTTLGEILARKLGYKFIDIDNIIEKKAGKTIKEIFDEEGASYFREIEKEALKEILGLKNIVVSLGCLLYTSPSPRDLSTSRMPSSA